MSRLRFQKKPSAGLTATLVLGAFCVILFIGEKVMIDEIGREYRLGWESLGEWMILYGFLTIQLIYILIILLQLLRKPE